MPYESEHKWCDLEWHVCIAINLQTGEDGSRTRFLVEDELESFSMVRDARVVLCPRDRKIFTKSRIGGFLMLRRCRNHYRNNNNENHTCQNNAKCKVPLPRWLLQLLKRLLYRHDASVSNSLFSQKSYMSLQSKHTMSTTAHFQRTSTIKCRGPNHQWNFTNHLHITHKNERLRNNRQAFVQELTQLWWTPLLITSIESIFAEVWQPNIKIWKAWLYFIILYYNVLFTFLIEHDWAGCSDLGSVQKPYYENNISYKSYGSALHFSQQGSTLTLPSPQ